MPELPEVNSFKRYFDATSLHQKVEEVHARDDYIFKGISPAAFEEKLRGRTFTGSYRRGKYFFPKLDNGQDLLLHFGMSGSFKYYSDPEEQPTYEHLAFHFDTGYVLGFRCPRKLARVRYLEDREAFIQDKKLGPDATEVSEEEFMAIWDGKRGTLKNLLMGQQNLAGLGNMYVDEICYQVNIHPASKVEKIPPQKRADIYRKMKEILEFALEKNATYSEYPSSWLWSHRKPGIKDPGGEGKIEKKTIAGRSTYYVPGRQKYYE